MKKKIALTVFSLCVLCFAANKANAQASDNANLTVDLQNVVSLTVANPTVSIPFTTASHYQSGNSTTASNHVQIVSSSGYTVKVKASASDLTDGSNNIPVSTIGITPTVASGGSPTLANVSGLTTSDQTIATSASGTLATAFNIQYTASGGASYLNKPASSYGVTIVYTIEP